MMIPYIDPCMFDKAEGFTNNLKSLSKKNKTEIENEIEASVILISKQFYDEHVEIYTNSPITFIRIDKCIKVFNNYIINICSSFAKGYYSCDSLGNKVIGCKPVDKRGHDFLTNLTLYDNQERLYNNHGWFIKLLDYEKLLERFNKTAIDDLFFNDSVNSLEVDTDKINTRVKEIINIEKRLEVKNEKRFEVKKCETFEDDDVDLFLDI